LANTLLKEKRLFIDPFQISHKKDYTAFSNPKHEARNSKQDSKSKIQMFETKRQEYCQNSGQSNNTDTGHGNRDLCFGHWDI